MSNNSIFPPANRQSPATRLIAGVCIIVPGLLFAAASGAAPIEARPSLHYAVLPQSAPPPATEPHQQLVQIMLGGFPSQRMSAAERAERAERRAKRRAERAKSQAGQADQTKGQTTPLDHGEGPASATTTVPIG